MMDGCGNEGDYIVLCLTIFGGDNGDICSTIDGGGNIVYSTRFEGGSMVSSVVFGVVVFTEGLEG